MSEQREPASHRDPEHGARQPWSRAAEASIGGLAAELDRRARSMHEKVRTADVHDMRTATRRLRTAIEIYRDATRGGRRRQVADELRRVARRLGSVRDLDVLLEGLADAGTSDTRTEARDRRPLQQAWMAERRRAAGRLRHETGRRRFRRSLKGASRLLRAVSPRANGDEGAADLPLVAHRAPALLWAAFGEVLAFDLDPHVADSARIHRMRLAAKRLRYTLEAFEDVLVGAPNLIGPVKGLQDAAGRMHDAIVAQERARAFLAAADLDSGQRRAIEAFAMAQQQRADVGRATIARRLATVRSRTFRRRLGRAVVRIDEPPARIARVGRG